jgi:hypothetical protein
MTCFASNRFTQTDPMPYGAGSAFEGSYVYAGARPTVMTDPGGMRFAFPESGVNPIRFDSNAPPTTKVIVRNGYRCVTRAATPEELKKNPIKRIVTICKKIPRPTTTVPQRLFGQHSGLLLAGGSKSVTVGFSWDIGQGTALFRSIDVVGHNLNAAESADSTYSDAIFVFEICGSGGCYKRIAVNAQTTTELFRSTRKDQAISIGLDAKVRLEGYSYGKSVGVDVCYIRSSAVSSCQ